MNNLKTLIFLLHIVEILSFDLSQIKFIIMSQNHTRHASFGLETEEKLKVKLKVYCQCFFLSTSLLHGCFSSLLLGVCHNESNYQIFQKF